MDFPPQAVCLCRVENLKGLFRGEESAVAEHVHKVGEAFGGHCRQHFPAYHIHIFTLAPGVCPSYRMGSEESRPDFHRQGGSEPADYAEHLEFVLRIQTVTAFDFQCSRAHVHHFDGTLERLSEQLFFGSFMQQVCRVQDAASPGCYLFVCQSVDLVPEFSVAGAGIDYMRVGVAE